MIQIKQTGLLKRCTLFMAAAGFLIGFFGCLEKEDGSEIYPKQAKAHLMVNAFGLFKMNLTLIDVDTKEPLPDLLVKLSNNTPSQRSNPEEGEQVTNADGTVHITIAAAPPVPQEFVLSFADTTQIRSFQQTHISVYFFNPVFKYLQGDAVEWGKFYQGTAEMTLTRELKQIYNEDYE